jgi:hypothetical protein
MDRDNCIVSDDVRSGWMIGCKYVNGSCIRILCYCDHVHV